MGIINTIKNFFKKNKTLAPGGNPDASLDKDIVPYDTSLVILPQYEELSKKEQEMVNAYMGEVNIEDTSTMITYATNMSEYASANVNLLIKVFDRITQKPADWQLENMSPKQVQEARLEALIGNKELQIFQSGLAKLKQESILRAVALHELVKREDKRKIEFLKVFARAEHMKRKEQKEQLGLAEERMKITVKTIEQLMQAVSNATRNEGEIASVIDTYNTLAMTDNCTEDMQRKVIAQKARRLLEMANEVIPEEAKKLGKIAAPDFDMSKEEETITKLARFAKEVIHICIHA